MCRICSGIVRAVMIVVNMYEESLSRFYHFVGLTVGNDSQIDICNRRDRDDRKMQPARGFRMDRELRKMPSR